MRLPSRVVLGARGGGAVARLARLVGLCALALVGARVAGAASRPVLRIAVVVDRTGRLAAAGQEVLDGVRHAAAWHGPRVGAAGLEVEVLPFDDQGRPEESVKAYEAALKARADAVIAAPTGRSVEGFVARARKGKVPVVLVGGAPPRPVLDPKDPVAFLGAWPADLAQFAAASLVTPCRSRKPGFLVEDTPRGRELEVLLQKALPPGVESAGAVRAAPGALSPSALSAWKDAGCDRLVVVGEPDLLDAAVRGLAAARWDVPLLALDGALSGSAPAALTAPAERVLFVVGAPQLVMTGAPRPLEDAVAAAGAPAGPVLPRTVRAWLATQLLCESALGPGGKPAKDADVVAALRERRYGPEESRTTVLDQVAFASLYRWSLWSSGPAGPQLLPATRAPAEGFGTLLGTRRPAAYRAEPGTKVVWVTFGDEKSRPPRSVERDLAELGLATRGYEGNLDFYVREELMARVLGKLNRLFLKNEDGTGVPGVSFAVSFVTERPKDLAPSAYFTAVVAGDDEVAGGRAFPGEGRAATYLTYLRRTIFQPNAIHPAVGRDDTSYFTGSHAWKGAPLEHARHDQVRALLDGLAGAIALTTAHEVGHLFGLGHDESDPRSLMNVAEGAGLRETQAVFIPAHAAVIERAVGRWKDPAARR